MMETCSFLMNITRSLTGATVALLILSSPYTAYMTVWKGDLDWGKVHPGLSGSESVTWSRGLNMRVGKN